MAKKKAPVVLTEPETPKAEDRGYTIGRWAGQPQYRCKACPFDTLDLDAMLDHLVWAHSPLAEIREPEPQPAPDGGASPLQPDEVAQGIYEVDLEEEQ